MEGLTPQMAELRRMYLEAREDQKESLEDYENAAETVDKLEAKWSIEFYSAELKATGTVQQRRAQAELKAHATKTALNAAKTVKRSAEKRHRDATKRLEAIAALGHAYNRELKTLEA